jgi:hypothetical protein
LLLGVITSRIGNLREGSKEMSCGGMRGKAYEFICKTQGKTLWGCAEGDAPSSGAGRAFPESWSSWPLGSRQA